MKSAKELARYYQNKKTLLGMSTEKATAIYQRINHYTIESDVILFSFSGFQKQLHPYRHEGAFIYVLTPDYLLALDASENQNDQKFPLKTLNQLSIQPGLYYHHLTFVHNQQDYSIDSTSVEDFFSYLTELLPIGSIKSADLEEKEDIEVEISALEINRGAKDNWLITLSFGQSSSVKLPQAVELAKKTSSYFEEQTLNGQRKYYASYTKENYLAFIQLYEIVGLWKSTSIKIQDKSLERKIIGGLNHCYGDKLKSTNEGFCFGASSYTNNPFGCHRLKISAGNHPWWSFGAYNEEKKWVIDKIALKKRILLQSQPYLYCPAFDLAYSILILDALPPILDPKTDQENWIFYNDSVLPRLTGKQLNFSDECS